MNKRDDAIIHLAEAIGDIQEGRWSLAESTVKKALRIIQEKNSEGSHECPECGDEMTIEEMLTHRLKDHDLSVVAQLQDVPESLEEQDD